MSLWEQMQACPPTAKAGNPCLLQSPLVHSPAHPCVQGIIFAPAAGCLLFVVLYRLLVLFAITFFVYTFSAAAAKFDAACSTLLAVLSRLLPKRLVPSACG